MTNRVKRFSSMDDCIHLHACRRVQAIGKKFRLNVPRYCDCYLSKNEGTSYITIRKAVSYACNGAASIRDGYDEYDVYASCDLRGASLAEILDDIGE